MQQNRSRMVWIVAIMVAFFFLIDPFRLFTSRRIPEARVNEETVERYAAFLAGTATADEAIVSLFQDADVVLIGESGYARQHAQFAAELIPVLQSAGIHRLGYQYANASDQALIDRLLTAPVFDDDLAREILFHHLTIFGFEEHRAIFRAAWEVNRRQPGPETPFRIIGISTPPVYREITSQKDIEDAEVMRRVFARGVPDVQMAQTISREFLDAGVQAAVFVQAEHAYTGFRQTAYEEQMADLGFAAASRAGAMLREEYGSRVVSAVLHGPVQDTRSRVGYGYPFGGLLEKAYLRLPEPRRSSGFRTDASPFAGLPLASDVLQRGQSPQVTFERFADAYLVVAPIRELEAVTPIPDFITLDNLAAAIRDFPGVSPEDATVADFNGYIAGNAARMADVYSQFQ